MASSPAAMMSSHHHQQRPPLPHPPHQYSQQQQQQQQSQFQQAQAYNQPLQSRMPPLAREPYGSASGSSTPPGGAIMVGSSDASAEMAMMNNKNKTANNVSPTKDEDESTEDVSNSNNSDHLLQQQHQPIVEEPSNHITVLREHDVLLGRGGGTNNHTGNIAFRKLVQQHKMRYLACSKVEKPKVARHVVALWRALSPPGRFLARVDGDEDVLTEEDVISSAAAALKPSVWYEVGDKKANAKASQCLRERTPEVMPYLRQLREQQDQHTEQGLHQFRQQQAQLQQQQQHAPPSGDSLSPSGSGHDGGGAGYPPHVSPSGRRPQMVGSSAGFSPQQQPRGMFSAHQQQHQQQMPYASPTHQREIMSMAAMQQQQQHHMASLVQSPGMMQPHNVPSALGAGGPGGMSHHVSPSGGGSEAFQMSPSMQRQQQIMGGMPMAPQLQDMGPPHPMAPGSSAAGMSSMGGGAGMMPADEFGGGIAVEDMTDLEYEQSMMIMQQQLQMQQMQLKRMQQQRSMQRAAMLQQQAHFDNMSPVKATRKATVSGAGVMASGMTQAPPMAGSSAEHPVEISQEMSIPPPPPPPLPPGASPRGLTRHAGLAPGASPPLSTNKSLSTSARGESAESGDQVPQEEEKPMEASTQDEGDMEDKPASNDGDNDDEESRPHKKTATTTAAAPKPIRSALKRSDSPKGPTVAPPAANKPTDSAPRKPPKRSFSGTQRPSVPDRTASGFMSIGSNDPNHPGNPANAGAELTLEEYRQQLEDYIASHAQIHVDDNAAGHGGPGGKPDGDNVNDGADSDLEDDWEQENTKSTPARRSVPRRSSSSRKGVDRHKSNTSMMSLDTRGSSNISIFSNLSDLSNGLNNAASAANNQKKSAPGRSVSNLSIMSELTDLSQNMDELSIREES